jgi:alpha-glucosidase
MSSWWEQAVIYEIYPRSFADSDGDGVGDLPGIAARLDHIASLGVDAIWLAPFYPSPLDDVGYDVADHSRADPALGGDEAFDELLAAAHERGLRVIVDLVASHTSIEHPWFREHPEYYVWREGDELPNNWIASFGGPSWTLDPERGAWYLHSFFVEQPDLDWRRPDVREAMARVIRGWVERGVDGFRIDAVDRLMKDPDLRDDPPADVPFPFPMAEEGRMRELIHSRDSEEITVALEAIREAAGPDALLVGEAYLPADRLTRYLGALDLVFAFDLLHAPWDAGELRAAIERLDRVGEGRVAWVLSNHDFSRVATRWGERHARAALVLALTLGGCAFLYQGDEIAMVDGPGHEPPIDRFGRDAFRHPMQWEPTADGGFGSPEPWLPIVDPERRSVAAQDGDPESVLALTRRLVELRKRLSGRPELEPAEPGMIAFRRGEHLVAINAGEAPAALSRAGEPLLLSGPGALQEDRLAAGAAIVVALDV